MLLAAFWANIEKKYMRKNSIVQNRSVVVCLTCSLAVIFLKCLCQPIKGFWKINIFPLGDLWLLHITLALEAFASNPRFSKWLADAAINIIKSDLGNALPSIICFVRFLFFLSGFSLTETNDSQDSKGMEGTIFYSTLPLLPAHEHWDIYFKLCMWDEYPVFLIATLVFTRRLLDEIYHFIELPLIDWLMMQCLLVYLMNWF